MHADIPGAMLFVTNSCRAAKSVDEKPEWQSDARFGPRAAWFALMRRRCRWRWLAQCVQRRRASGAVRAGTQFRCWILNPL